MSSKQRRLKIVEHIVDAAGIAPELEALIGKGRPRQLPVRTLLVAMIASGHSGRPAFLKQVRKYMKKLDRASQWRLGIRYQTTNGAERVVSYRQVVHLFNAIVKLCDAQPVLRRRPGEDRETWTERIKAAEPPADAAAAAEQLLKRICDALLAASLPAELRSHGNFALDWTDVETYARGRKRADTSADSNARWGTRRSNAPGTKSESYFGYKETTVALVKNEGGPAVPGLIVSAELCAANQDAVPASLRMLQSLIDRGVRPGELLADSAYPWRVDWSLTAKALGFTLSVDLHPKDKGFEGTEQGALIHNGEAFCPQTPLQLFHIKERGDKATEEEIAAHAEAWNELNRYRFQSKGRPDTMGYQRLMCPAAAGKARCALVPESLAGRKEKPRIFNPPPEPPTCCTQRSMTIGPEVGAKTRQKYPWDSPAWHDSYARRTEVERSYARIKDIAGENLQRGSIRVLGRAKIMLLRICRWVLHNIRVLGSHLKKTAAPETTGGPNRAPRRPNVYKALLAKLRELRPGSPRPPT